MRVLPNEFHDAVNLLYHNKFTSEEKDIGKSIEAFRSEIGSNAKSGEMFSYSSPGPNTFKKDDKGHAINTGSYVSEPIDAHRRVGIDMFGGILLRRLANRSADARY